MSVAIWIRPMHKTRSEIEVRRGWMIRIPILCRISRIVGLPPCQLSATSAARSKRGNGRTQTTIFTILIRDLIRIKGQGWRRSNRRRIINQLTEKSVSVRPKQTFHNKARTLSKRQRLRRRGRLRPVWGTHKKANLTHIWFQNRHLMMPSSSWTWAEPTRPFPRWARFLTRETS